MLEVKRKPNETFESLLRRFTKKTIQSGKLLQAKKIKYFQKDKTDKAKKEAALMRNEMKDKREYMRKIGKLDELIDKKRKKR